MANKREIVELEEQVVDKESRGLQRYIESRKKAIAKKYEKSLDGMDFAVEGINAIAIQRALFEPLYEPSRAVRSYTAAEILMALEYYSEMIERINKTTLFPPQLEQFCRLLGISTNNFRMNYLNSNEDEKRNAAQQVVDFISMVLSYAGMTRQIDNTAQIFVQKSGLGRKDNEQPTINNNNNTIVITPEEFAKQVESLKH